MREIIWGQVLFVLASLCSGMLLMTGYDALRLIRWLFPHRKGWFWVGDTLYWSLASVPTFYLFFSYNEGTIRWYGLLGVLLGGILYETGISMPIRSTLGPYGNKIRSWIRRHIERIRRWHQKHANKWKQKADAASAERKRKREERRKEKQRKKKTKKEKKQNQKDIRKNTLEKSKKKRDKGLHK